VDRPRGSEPMPRNSPMLIVLDDADVYQLLMGKWVKLK
jgi:hypothetical protein